MKPINHIDPIALEDLLVAAMENCSPGERLELIWQAFEQDNSCCIPRPPSDNDRTQVEKWYREKMLGNHRIPLGYIRLLKPPVCPSIPYKAINFLDQACCYTCEPLIEPEGKFKCSINFPIQVRPWSAQSSQCNSEIKAAVNDELRCRSWCSPVSDIPFCIGIVALVPRSSRRKDCDNLAKGILDAMEGIVYVNDSQIQCLTVRRMEYSGNVGIYLIRADAVEPWGCDVINDSNVSPIVLSGRPVTF